MKKKIKSIRPEVDDSTSVDPYQGEDIPKDFSETLKPETEATTKNAAGFIDMKDNPDALQPAKSVELTDDDKSDDKKEEKIGAHGEWIKPKFIKLPPGFSVGDAKKLIDSTCDSSFEVVEVEQASCDCKTETPEKVLEAHERIDRVEEKIRQHDRKIEKANFMIREIINLEPAEPVIMMLEIIEEVLKQ